MNFKDNKKKYLLYGIVAILLLLSTLILKSAITAQADDNNVTVRTARITGIATGTEFDAADGIVEDADGNMTSHTAGADSSAGNRLVKSNDQIEYNIAYSIGGINNDNNYYSRTVDIKVDLSSEEAKYVSFDRNKVGGETSKTYSFDNVSSTGPEYESKITLYVINCPDNIQIAPKFTISVRDSSGTQVVLGKNDSGNLDYKYDNGRYTNTNRSTVTNYLPTIVSATATTMNYNLVSSTEGQKAIYNGQLGRFFTAVIVTSVPNTKGTYIPEESLSLPITTTGSGSGEVTINDNWVRLYNTELVDTIEAVRVYAPYSVTNGGTANDQTRQPGSVSYSSGTANISGFSIPAVGPGVSASGEVLPTDNKIIGTYAVSLFSSRVKADGKNDVNVTLNVGNKSVSFVNQYYENSDYNLTSGFYDEEGKDRLTTYVNSSGEVVNLPSSTSKGSTITYKTNFKYKKTGSDSGLKQVLKVDPIAFRIIPFSDKKDVEIKLTCGKDECTDITSDDFEFKFITGDFVATNYSIDTLDSRVSEENQAYASSQCSALSSALPSFSREQVMNLYGGPCIKGNGEEIFDKINDSRDTETDAEKPITKVVVQTKEGVVLPDDATVNIIVKLRVRNVADITRSYQAGVVLSTADSDSELYYFVPTIDGNVTSNILNQDNYVRSTFTGINVNLNSTAQYADSIRIVNFTARQSLTVTNTEADGTIKTDYEVGQNEIIQYKLSTNVKDLNEQVGADDVWYIKAIRVYVNIPKELDYVPDASLGTPEVIDLGNDVKQLVYTLPWTKPNFKIPDIYFNTKLSIKLKGTRVPINVSSAFNPININDEYDASVLEARGANFVIYGTEANTVLLSQTNEGRTVVDRNETFTYSLHAYNNSGQAVTDYILEDILPFKDDSRGSKFNGSYEVKVTLPTSQPLAKVYCTTKDPKTINGKVNNSEDEYTECDATEDFVKATAIRITGISLANDQNMDPIKISLKPNGNKFSDKYINDFNGDGAQVTKQTSNKVKISVINRMISGRVFIDSNDDGVRNENEKFYSEGINVTLYKVENAKMVKVSETIKTNKDGEYKFNNLEAGYYRVRLEYDSKNYDLALRYGSENTATDSDAYKITDSEAEISGKYVPGTIEGIDLTVFERSTVEDMDMGLVPKQTFGFTMKKYITQVDLSYNNTLDSQKYDNLSTVALNVRNTLSATAKVYYGISITNTSNTAGYVKSVYETIPDGLTFDVNDPYNAQWKIVDNKLKSTVYENEEVQPGETKYLQIAMTMPSSTVAKTYINEVEAEVEEYIPQELAKEAEFASDSYAIGDALSFAGVNWHVIGVENLGESGEQNVTLLADTDTISTNYANSNGSVYKWGESPINTYINDYAPGGWLSTNSINHSILLDQVACNDSSSLNNPSYGGTLLSAGTCTSNDYVTTKVRLLNEEDYERVKSANLNELDWFKGGKNYWTMSSVDNTVTSNIYGVQQNTSMNMLAKYIDGASGTIKADKSASTTLEVRPVITISSKNITLNH